MEKQYVLLDVEMMEKAGMTVGQAIVKYLGDNKQTVFPSLDAVKEAAVQSNLKGTFRVACREVSPWENVGEVIL